jgi:hypothetical protein
VDDPDHIGAVEQLGIDETSFLAANRSHAMVYGTGLVDLEAKVVIDMVEGNAPLTCGDGRPRPIPDGWAASRWWPPIWPSRSEPGCRLIWTAPGGWPIRSMWSAPGTGAWTRCGAGCRTTLGHRGGKRDPLYRIRKLLLSGHKRLDEVGHQRMLLGLRVGDPADEVLGAWLAKGSVRNVYLAEDRAEAALLLDKAIAGCADDVEEICSLGSTLAQWCAEILAHHDTGASNGPTEGLTQPVREEGQAVRPWLPHLRALPAAGAAPRRRRHLAEPVPSAGASERVVPTRTRRAPQSRRAVSRTIAIGAFGRRSS